jgi:hypothetical protein
MRIYKRFSRFQFRRAVSRSREKRIQWALSLKPGDLINICSGFNVVVKDIEPFALFNGRGYAICDVDITYEPFGGGCSLIHCGVWKPLLRDEIEKRYMDYLKWWVSSPKGAAKWYGLDNPQYKEEIDKCKLTLNMLENNEHICDERGIKYE